MTDFVETAAEVTKEPNVAKYVDQAIRLHDYLSWQADLSPRNYGVNSRLSAFVNETMRRRPRTEIHAILQTPRIRELMPALQRLVGRAEFEMEKFCAAAFTGDTQGVEDKRYTSFDDFIYLKNYEALIAQEMRALGWPKRQPPLDPKTQSIAFIGAGPLPISAVMLHMQTGHPVTCIDTDREACRLGQRLIQYLSQTNPRYAGLADKMTFVHAAGEQHDYVTHPIVFIASLVPQKTPIIVRIIDSSNTTARVVIRSSAGLSTLLYNPHPNLAGLEEYNFYFTGETKPSATAINTSLVYKLLPGKVRTRNKIDFETHNPFVGKDQVESLQPRPRPMWRTMSDAATI